MAGASDVVQIVALIARPKACNDRDYATHAGIGRVIARGTSASS